MFWLASGAFTTPCPADYVTYTPPGGPVVVNESQPFYQIDLNNDDVIDFEIEIVSGTDGGSGDTLAIVVADLVFSLSSENPSSGNLIDSLNNLVEFISPGDDVGPTGETWTDSSNLDDFVGKRGYAAIRFVRPNAERVSFAVLDIEINDESNVLTLRGGGYESADLTPFTAPAMVPEPTSALFLVGSVLGCIATRRKRRDLG